MRKTLQILILLFAVPAISGCYYLQAAAGHLDLMRRAQPIEALLADPATDAALAEQLERALRIRRFAVDALALPDNRSYTRYADLERDSVVWNVVAVPEFSLDPRIWCFPVAGCLSYRGYFSESRAQALAARLTAQGYDTQVGRVAAYSTLGRFSDPVLNTMVDRGETYLAGLVFHELAHQKLYVSGDTDFNEAYATAIEEYGTRRWLKAQGNDEALTDYALLLERRGVLDTLIEAQRERLAQIYASVLDESSMRDAKSAAFQQMRLDYVVHRAQWTHGPNFDGFFARPLNNAHLLAVSTYRALVPAFHRLLDDSEDIETFHRRAEALGAMPKQQRHDALRQMLDGAIPEAGVAVY